MFKKQIATAILLIGGIMSSSYLFSQNEPETISEPIDYGGICCDNFGSVCYHPNGMTFLGAKWYSGGPYCP
ncbi:hypothetical protein [Marivirga sp.]|uniref:hypothetical protein n=1 Tax=Marivirga sp. TaxID=2018662 RepID=UPI0025E1BE89|nr:hypothetical protein [Marivirga sp.]